MIVVLQVFILAYRLDILSSHTGCSCQCI